MERLICQIPTSALLAVGVALGCSGCYTGINAQPEAADSNDEMEGGVSEDPGDDGDDAEDEGGEDSGEPSQPGADGELTYSPVSRLKGNQWKNTVVDAFGLSAEDVSSITLPIDGTDGVFVTNAGDRLGDFSEYVGAAESVGELVAPSLVTECSWSESPDTCTDQTLTGPASILLRRPATAEDLAPVRALVVESLGLGLTAQEAVALGVSRLVLDPHFLFLMEHPKESLGDDTYSMFDTELAARLAYTVTDRPPDAELRGVVEDGALSESETFAAEVDRILERPDAREMIWRFTRGWLSISQQEGQLGADMMRETRLFVEHVLLDDSVPLSDLFTAKYSFINARLAEHYGVPAPQQDWERYDFPEDAQRMGVLTHASFLSSNASAERENSKIFRGKILIERLFCQHLPPPPADALEVAGEVEDRTTDARCSGCHLLLDPAGHLFNQYREDGTLFGDDETSEGSFSFGDVSGDYGDVLELNAALGSSDDVAACLTEFMFRYALTRIPAEQDHPSIEAAVQAMLESRSPREALAAILTSPAFTTVYIEDHQDG